MKRTITLLCCLLMLCLMLPASGIAQTQEEWNLSCTYKTRTSTPVYSTSTLESVENINDYYVTTLPANTYVKKRHWAPPWRKVEWMSNGSIQSGYINGDDIIYCASKVQLEGSDAVIPISELDPNHDALVASNPVMEIAPSLIESGKDYSNVAYIALTSYADEAIRSASTPQEKWDLSCSKKTTATTTVYKQGVENEVMMTIPANTYFKLQDTMPGWQIIEFMIDGTKYRGRIPTGFDADTQTQVTGANGLPDTVHELDPRYNDIVGGKGEYEVTFVETQTESKDTTTASDYTPSSLAQLADNVDVVGADEEATPPTDEATAVRIVELGTYQTVVELNGEDQTVLTADLTFSESVPEEQKVAVIHTPKTGKATMRASASKKGDHLKTCKAGTVVSVLEVGDDFTLISDDGRVGYVLNSCLSFHAPVTEPEGTAALSYKGKTNGSTTVNIRNQPDKHSAKAATWKTGTELVVLGFADGWYEVEANGVRGFVMEEYITLGE